MRTNLILLRRSFASTTTTNVVPNIRNIGVAAHVDAGKTTVVERMLYYSNKTGGIGEVHDGAATMDYLPQERERGITINAAAISFDWSCGKKQAARINLVDTPGHYDFTTEVERALRVLDGAVIVFDAVEGVEAQTETVWRQANRYDVPRIAFANKMDRDGASIDKVITSMKSRLECEPLQIHSPIGEWANFRGFYDVIQCKKYLWEAHGGESMGREYSIEECTTALPESVQNLRKSIFEKIADLDDKFAEEFLANDCSSAVELKGLSNSAKEALRRITLAQALPINKLTCTRPGVPVFCGSALKNTGIQTLLDAVIEYLPNPTDRPKNKFNSNDKMKSLLAFVFKVQNDVNRGLVAFVRIYQGKMKMREQVRVSTPTTMERKERILSILQAEAKSYIPFDFDEANAGDICVIIGCPNLRTGETIGDGPALPGLTIPPPVYTMALELESISMEPKFLEAISIMTRDDPSLIFLNDVESGQFLLSGIGELHLEVSLDRLKREHGVRVQTNPPHVGYKETIPIEVHHTHVYDKVMNGNKFMCKISLTMSPNLPFDDAEPHVIFEHDSPSSLQGKKKQDGKKVEMKKPSTEPVIQLTQQMKEAIKSGILSGLSRGPIKGHPVRGVTVSLKHISFNGPSGEDSLNVLRSACASCVLEMLMNHSLQAQLLEPIFSVDLIVPDKTIGDVLGDLSGRRRADISLVEPTSRERTQVKARVPAIELLSYSKVLRSLTGGQASYSATFDKYAQVTT